RARAQPYLEGGTLGKRIGGADRLAEVELAIAPELARGGSDPAGNGIHWQRHPDDARGGDGHGTLHADARSEGRCFLHLGGVVEPGAAGRGIRVARVHDDGPQAAELTALER